MQKTHIRYGSGSQAQALNNLSKIKVTHRLAATALQPQMLDMCVRILRNHMLSAIRTINPLIIHFVVSHNTSSSPILSTLKF